MPTAPTLPSLALAAVLVVGGCAGLGNQPPTLVDVEVSPPTLSSASPVDIIATVADADGVVDVVGVQLQGDDGARIGSFEALPDRQDAVVYRLGWSEANQLRPIDLAPGATATRSFTLIAFDVAGARGTAQVEVALACSEGQPACGGACGAQRCEGRCVDLESDPLNCGACGEACVGRPELAGLCRKGVCVTRQPPPEEGP